MLLMLSCNQGQKAHLPLCKALLLCCLNRTLTCGCLLPVLLT